MTSVLHSRSRSKPAPYPSANRLGNHCPPRPVPPGFRGDLARFGEIALELGGQLGVERRVLRDEVLIVHEGAAIVEIRGAYRASITVGSAVFSYRMRGWYSKMRTPAASMRTSTPR